MDVKTPSEVLRPRLAISDGNEEKVECGEVQDEMLCRTGTSEISKNPKSDFMISVSELKSLMFILMIAGSYVVVQSDEH